MKNWKKPLAAVLVGMLCVISMPQMQPLLPAFSAAAAEETGTVGALTYTLKSDRAIITQCDKSAEEVVIPSGIAGKPVTENPHMENPVVVKARPFAALSAAPRSRLAALSARQHRHRSNARCC